MVESVYRPRFPAAASKYPVAGRTDLCRLSSIMASIWVLAACPVFAETIYDNAANALDQYVSLPGEFGDEIQFAGSARTVVSLEFEVVGETNIPPVATVRFRLYLNDGPLPPPTEPQFPTPGTVLYESEEIPVHAGVQPVRILDLQVEVPESVIWTAEFLHVGPVNGESAGMRVYHPPVIGRSFRDYWVRDASGFHLYLLDSGAPASFAARFEALPDPPTRLAPSIGSAGNAVIEVSGPIGSTQVLETSSDLTNWVALQSVTLTTNSVATLVDPGPSAGPARYYRTRLTADPQPVDRVGSHLNY